MIQQNILSRVALLLIIILNCNAHGTTKTRRKDTEGGGLDPLNVPPDILEKIVTFPSLSVPPLNPAEFPIGIRNPLEPLNKNEIRLAALILRAENITVRWQFKCIALHEPEKALLLSSFLADSPPPAGLDRKAGALIVDRSTMAPYFVIINLTTRKSERWMPAAANVAAPSITGDDMDIVGNVVFSHPEVLDRIKKLGYAPTNVITDIWEAGYVKDNPTYAAVRKLLQVFFYGLNGQPGENFYAHPLDFVVYVDLGAQAVRGIENLPIQQDFNTENRTGASVPRDDYPFVPSLFPPNTIREDVSPIKITQPGGPSFKVNGRQISWQNFKFIVGYNPREGVVLHQISYNDNGEVRPLFYRISLSESFVQYTDPRPPYHRKASYDMGNFEFGTSTQELPLHQFCRGEAYYYSNVIHNDNAETTTVDNAICVFEEDSGILYGHYEWLSGETIAARSQRLSVSNLVNIGNVDYFLSWRFYQDATIELAVKMIGVLSTNLLAVDVKPPPYGNLLAPQVYAQNFQYYLAARIDPAIDGEDNTVSFEEPVSIADPVENPYGNGVRIQSTVFKTAGESPSDIKPGSFWRISNPNHIQSLNGQPVSWKVLPSGGYVPPLIADGSPISENLQWTKHSMWVLPFNDDQVFVDNLYLDNGVATSVLLDNATANIEDTDVVLWHVFGFLHLPDTEDWPVVSSCPGTTGFRLRPSNFFNENPAKTVPQASVTTRLDGESDGGWGPSPGWNSQPTGWKRST